MGYTPTWNKTGDELTNIQGNIEVTAEYTANTYKVTYDADGFDIDGKTVQLTYNAECTALDMSLTSETQKFLGWEYNGVTYTPEIKWNVAKDVTLTAKWADKDKFVITFKNTDNTTTMEVLEGNTLTNIPTPAAKTGYDVDTKWYADEACTEIATFTNITEGFTVYAKATPKNYTITYVLNGGYFEDGVASTQTVTFDENYTLATPKHEKTYMHFDGWKNAEGNIITNGIWKTDADIQLTAEWKDTREVFTITFVQAGQEAKKFTVKAGESFTDIPKPATKTGYNVVWDKTEFSNVTEDITVNAVETAKTYTITLDAGDGEVSQTTITVTYGETYELPTPTIEDKDKEFDGWVYNETQKLPTKGTWKLDLDNITLKAVWKEVGWTANY